MFAFVLAAGITLSPTPSPSPTPKPYRTLIYEITSADAALPAATLPPYAPAVPSPASPTPRATPSPRVQPSAATLTLTIPFRPAAGGTAVDVAYRDAKRTEDTVRISIASDGSMSWDQNRQLNRRELLILPLLAPSFVEHDFTAGEGWSSPARPPLSGSISYRVLNVQGTIANLAVTYALTVPVETGTAALTYDTFHVCPTKLDLRSRSPEAQAGGAHIIAHLVSDSSSDLKRP